ncbi:MAG: 4-hydroxy-tetrahydrodipicolinate synthase [Verrucomicrobiales bacterium]|jgi:4-hydroxy-tetrahydrodipicolinate synthase|nr:4-hydroxy-tetrahydrodipicolinate synthase [Verrucomicrobiales bacterium]
MFKGTITALVTPFKNGLVDGDAFGEMVEKQVAAGIEGVVPVGTTGESPTLTRDEHLRVVELAVRRAAGRTKVIAGSGSNSTREAIEYTQEAEKIGADAALLVAPYYNKPTQEGVYRHFMAVANNTALPLVLYSIPGRCGIEITVETVARLAVDAQNIVAIKESGGNVDRVSKLRQALPDNFAIISGDDGLTLPFMSVGACGVISVASNLFPAEVKAIVDSALLGDFRTAEILHRKYYPAFCDLFIESNPVPVKFALAAKGWMSDEVRLPLAPLSAGSREKLLATLQKVGVL